MRFSASGRAAYRPLNHRDAEGRLLAALAANRPRDIAAMRRELAGEATVAAA